MLILLSTLTMLLIMFVLLIVMPIRFNIKLMISIVYNKNHVFNNPMYLIIPCIKNPTVSLIKLHGGLVTHRTSGGALRPERAQFREQGAPAASGSASPPPWAFETTIIMEHTVPRTAHRHT